MSEKKLDLIAQLLAKAERTTPEEAEALTEHAARLMVKYGIEQARIDERRAKLGQASEKIIEARKLFTGVYAMDLRDLGVQVAFGLGTLRPLVSKTWKGLPVLHLVGFESDVQQAQVLIASLEVQAMIAMRAWWAEERSFFSFYTESEKRRARSGFLRGFGNGAAARIRSNRATVIAESGSGTDLVLLSRRERVDQLVDARDIGTARKRQEADESSFYDGDRAGREANTGEKAVGTGKAIER